MTRRRVGYYAIATPSTGTTSDAESPGWVSTKSFKSIEPLANPYAERVIGSIRRECLEHVIVLGERHLRHILTRYADYYHGARTHLSLAKDSPTPRPVQT